MMVLTFVLSQCFIVKLLTKPILLRIFIYYLFIYLFTCIRFRKHFSQCLERILSLKIVRCIIMPIKNVQMFKIALQ